MTPPWPNPALRSPAASRFAAALFVSALAHLAMPLVVSGGGALRSTAKDMAVTLSVRVLPQREATQAQPAGAVASDEPAAAMTPRTARVERAPRVVAPELQAQPSRSGAGVPEAPDFTFYPARQLDIYPKLVNELDLKYRGKAADDGVTGRALLLVLIDEIGAVKEVSVVEAEPANAFEDDAQRALLAARFAPAYRNGRAVRSRVLIAVNYGLDAAR